MSFQGSPGCLGQAGREGVGARSFGLLLLVRTSIYGLNVKAPSEELGEETQLEMSVENVQHTKHHGTHQTELAVGHLANVMQVKAQAWQPL